jgi:hypothetical protein
MKKTFTWRIFISFGLVVSFFMLILSGAILYISPPGRVANWMDWRLLGLTKTGWQNQHIIFGFTFAVLSLFHLFLINWKAFLSYLKSKTTAGLKNPVELSAVLTLALLFGIGTYFSIQPFSALIDFGNGISGSWERKEKQAPVPHAEIMSLIELSRQPGLGGDPEALKTKLENGGVKVVSVNQTLLEIAMQNGKTAEQVYGIIAPQTHGKTQLPAQGLGQKTLQQVADDAGIAVTSLQLALRQQGIEAEAGAPLKTVAEKNGLQMSDLRNILEAMINR